MRASQDQEIVQLGGANLRCKSKIKLLFALPRTIMDIDTKISAITGCLDRLEVELLAFRIRLIGSGSDEGQLGAVYKFESMVQVLRADIRKFPLMSNQDILVRYFEQRLRRML